MNPDEAAATAELVQMLAALRRDIDSEPYPEIPAP